MLQKWIAYLSGKYCDSLDNLAEIQQKVSNIQNEINTDFSNHESVLMLRELLVKELYAKRVFDFYTNKLTLCQDELEYMLKKGKKRKYDEM